MLLNSSVRPLVHAWALFKATSTLVKGRAGEEKQINVFKAVFWKLDMLKAQTTTDIRGHDVTYRPCMATN